MVRKSGLLFLPIALVSIVSVMVTADSRWRECETEGFQPLTSGQRAHPPDCNRIFMAPVRLSANILLLPKWGYFRIGD